jgi:hypothetical protein
MATGYAVSVGRAWQERIQTGVSPLFNQAFFKKNLFHLKKNSAKTISTSWVLV